MAKVQPNTTTLVANIGEEYTLETGAVPTHTYEGEINEIYTLYAAEKALAAAYGSANIASLRYEPYNGRARFIKAFVRPAQTIEELYAVEVQKYIAMAPYFQSLSNSEVMAVRAAYSNQEDADSGWGALQTALYKHLVFGCDSYIEKAFDLRINQFVSTNSSSKTPIDMSNIETVVSLPTLSANMLKLVSTLPTGEWLQGAMQAEHLGHGRWRLENILHWSKKWSVIYGGTLFA